MKKAMHLDKNYTVEVDTIGKDEWNAQLLNFEDATLYQTWEYGDVHWGKQNSRHLVLKKNGKIVAMVQARVKKLFFLNRGFAYVTWGPLWNEKEEEDQIRHFKNILKALYNEYVVRNKMFLRIKPKIITEGLENHYTEIYKDTNFRHSADPTGTIVMDLSLGLDEIRKNFKKSIKHSINFANKQNLEIEEGNDQNFVERILKIAAETKRRKKFKGSDQSKILQVSNKLSNDLKLKLLICKQEQEDIAAIGFQGFGRIGFPIVGGSTKKALETKASALLWLAMITYYKENGFKVCDLAGASKDKNPGTYFFKRAIAGKKYKEKEHYIGQFDACDCYFSKMIFSLAERIKTLYRSRRYI